MSCGLRFLPQHTFHLLRPSHGDAAYALLILNRSAKAKTLGESPGTASFPEQLDIASGHPAERAGHKRHRLTSSGPQFLPADLLMLLALDKAGVMVMEWVPLEEVGRHATVEEE